MLSLSSMSRPSKPLSALSFEVRGSLHFYMINVRQSRDDLKHPSVTMICIISWLNRSKSLAPLKPPFGKPIGRVSIRSKHVLQSVTVQLQPELSSCQFIFIVNCPGCSKPRAFFYTSESKIGIIFYRLSVYYNCDVPVLVPHIFENPDVHTSVSVLQIT